MPNADPSPCVMGKSAAYQLLELTVRPARSPQLMTVMLWWQAYLSSCGGMFGQPGAMPPSFPPGGWGMPPPGMQLPPGMFPPAPGAEALFPGLVNGGMGTAMGTKAGPASAPGGQAKRRRRQDSGGSGDGQANGGSQLSSANRKGRRPRQEERVCKNCGTRSTPFWRKDKHDGLPLCNACGLYLSKNDAPRPKVLWKSSDPSAVVVEQSNAACM
ncbi:unnamed protein product [Ostreobium quekettii]|uniref:GATA-type domain-containing protein n=1 Tax=Ostreobium quekettii TaxID=121088 RepID=A0A8S1ILZ9_9CHLO|nr:unnamed protein product [Ostreobium quekettii]